MRVVFRVWLAGVLTLAPALAWCQQEAMSGVGVDEAVSGPALLAAALAATATDRLPVPINLRLVVAHTDVEPRPGVYDFAALDARLAVYQRLTGVRAYIDVRNRAPLPDHAAGWGRFVRALAARYRGRVHGYVFGIAQGSGPRPPARDFAFHIKSTVVNLRAGDAAAVAILGGIDDADHAWMEALYLDDVAAYVDAIGLAPGSTTQEIPTLVDRHDPSATIVLLGQPLGDDGPTAVRRRFLDGHVGILGTRVAGATYAGSANGISEVLPVLTFLRDMLGQPLVALDETSVALRLMRDGVDVTATVPHRLLFGLRSATNYLIYAGAEGPVDLTLSDQTGATPAIADALTATRLAPRSFAYDAAAQTARIGLPGEPRPLIVDWNTGGTTILAERSDVSSTVMPTVAEIISRHQQADAVQKALVHSYITDAVMEQHFRTNAADPGFDVVTENRFFVQDGETEFEERSFRLNGTLWGADRPPFPLLQAEKVLSLPLDLRLSTDYRYRLEGVETVAGREAFAIRFDPVSDTQSLYRGTVWIDRATYLKVKVQTVQTRLSAPVLSSEEIQHFGSVGTLGGRDVFLLTGLVGRQSILIAGRNVLVERELTFEDFRLNPGDFERERQQSRAGEHVMYRDTVQGLRYLVKRDGQRVVDEGTTSVAKAMLIGATYDPAYDFPLPLGGINYLDFEFLGKDNQLAVIFGGVLALVNVQRPHLIGDTVDGSVDLFAIAVPGSDRTYDLDGERPGERLRTLPFSTGVNVGWRLAEFHRFVASYQFRFDKFSAEDTTASTFEVPASTSTNGAGLAWEWKQGGYSVNAGWTGYRRAAWRPWGDGGDYDPAHQSYAKYSVSVTKALFSGIRKLTLNGAYYGGRDLDRFSKYQFGFFDENRVHGVPSAGVRFGELGMLRGSYSFNFFEQYRLDLFLDQAVGRDTSVAPGWQAVTGVGVGFITRAPWNTMLRGDIGKSFLPSHYRKPGSIVFQLQVLKPL